MAIRLASVPFILLLLAVAATRAAPASETVEQICAEATSGGAHSDLAPFCVASLQAAPGSSGADARGLAAIATNLTLANYTAAVATVKDLQRRGGWSAAQRRALATCRQRYIEALNVVHSAVHALASGRFRDYAADMGVVGKAATDCEDAFGAAANAGGGSGGPSSSPLRKVDQDAVNLTTVAALIVRSLK
jgi:pectinesterase inhibitor-like protein